MNKCESCVRAIKRMCSREVSSLRDYQPVEYILMGSGSYIDTGVSLTGGAIGEMKINILSGNFDNGGGVKDGATSKNNRNYFSFYYDSGLSRYVIGIGAGGYNNVWNDYSFNTDYTISYNTPDHSYTLNGVNYNYGSTNWKDPQNPPYSRWNWVLHAGVGTDGTISPNTGEVKIYRYKLCDHNNELKIDLHPVIRKSDNVVGMYDTVSGTFFTNAGTGEFTAGTPINALPQDYQRVAWIQGNNTAYIDTGIKPDAQTGMEASGIFNGNANIPDVNIVAFGCRYSLNGTNYSLLCTSNGTMRFNYGTKGQTHVVENCTQFSFIPGIDMKFRYQCEDGTSGNVTIPVKSFNPALDLNFWLFAFNNNGTPSYGTCVVNYFKMYSGTMLTRSFVPCYRKSDSKTGMYDLVTHEFYPVIGTGEFTLGPEV